MVDVDAFIERWQGKEGGAERANYALFLSELCDVLGVGRPDPAGATHELNDYVFERAVVRREGGERSANKRIDLYKRNCFILEAKQSRWKGGDKAIPGQEDMFQAETMVGAGRRGVARNWDILMRNARQQAEQYALMLPADHDWPPFIIVCDVGHVLEIYADFNGKGRDYTQFPDRQGFRIYLEDLRRADIRERLRLIWTDPQALDPTRKAAEATRQVAERLAEVSKLLEGRGYAPERVAQFLMRCLFTMFAEDVELLPKKSFEDLLRKCAQDDAKFVPMVSQLWAAMNTGDWAYAIEAKVKRFNGEFFANPEVLPLNREEIGELLVAAGKEWRRVEPAIFGSLLEGALDPTERSRLGAHYTPRAYVERLVLPTIMEPLRGDWDAVNVTVEKLLEGKRDGEAIAAVRAFHEQLCALRVLDPACGTGNFLYVAMDKIKQLEDEVLETLAALGGQEALALDQLRVDPHQFLGIEINPRAAAIAELVLWIGFLQIHYRSHRDHPVEPILRAFHNIECRDAVLTWDGAPLPQVVDGKETYPNPRQPDWPVADFIVGNPPFLGKGEPMREAFGEAYLQALWKANPRVKGSADFVMYWWDRACHRLTEPATILRRFGLVTTNSIDQFFNRRVVEKSVGKDKPVSLVFAIADHPWTKVSRSAAAVRIAMTVCERGKNTPGKLVTVLDEGQLETDTPQIETSSQWTTIRPNLTSGPDLAAARALRANSKMASMGPALGGRGFVISATRANEFRAASEASHRCVRRLVTGKDITGRRRNRFILDVRVFESESELRDSVPEIFQHLFETVKPVRLKNNDKRLREKWWYFRRSNEDFNEMTHGLECYFATVETAKHRFFVQVSEDTLVEHGVVGFGSSDFFLLGTLSSRVHTTWSLAQGGTLESRPRYNKLLCFDPFPFPDPDERQKAEIADIAEKLDAHRKAVQAAHPEITLTEMYNVLEKLRAKAPGLRLVGTDEDAVVQPQRGRKASGTTLTAREEDIKTRGLILVLKDYHDALDAAVARAYGWPVDLSDEEILTRLVALNAERAAEEAAGQVRWLRPDYQIPRFGTAAQKADRTELDLVVPGETKKPSFPAEEVRRTSAIYAVLAGASGPLSAADIAGRFKQGKKVEREIALTLRAYLRYGDLASSDGGRTFTLRRAA